MRINHNIPALNAHRMLNRNANVSASVLERLSSGKKINRAADDAAGMAISEKMKAQVRGLAKAAQNTLDGISLIQTAEGAMNEVHSMLQRMRELAVQSANGTTTNDDRVAIQAEINQLTSEINRIANGTEFNTRNVLRGNEGPNSNTMVHRMSTGKPASFVAMITNIEDKDIKWDSLSLSIHIDGEKEGRDIRFSKLAQIKAEAGSDLDKTQMRTALLEAINDALQDKGKAIFDDREDGERYLEIRTVSVGGKSEIKFTGEDAINAIFYNSTDGKGYDLQGVPIDGARYRGSAENDVGNAIGSFYFDELPEVGSRLIVGDKIVEFFNSSIEVYTGSNIGIDLKDFSKETNGTNEDKVSEMVGSLASSLQIEGIELVQGNNESGVKNIFGDDVFNSTGNTGKRLYVKATDAKGFAGQLIYLEGTPKEFVTNLQVGPNQGQGFRLEIGDIRAHKLNISASWPDANPGIKNAKFYQEEATVTDGLSPNTIEYSLDVSTEETATAAITVYNNAIVKVAQMRGALGAIQNRLEYTAANLENTQENLTAALSRIEDTDMALEMSEFTKYNILIQAGTAMLAQANQRPQTVLQLLGG